MSEIRSPSLRSVFLPRRAWTCMGFASSNSNCPSRHVPYRFPVHARRFHAHVRDHNPAANRLIVTALPWWSHTAASVFALAVFFDRNAHRQARSLGPACKDRTEHGQQENISRGKRAEFRFNTCAKPSDDDGEF